MRGFDVTILNLPGSSTLKKVPAVSVIMDREVYGLVDLLTDHDFDRVQTSSEVRWYHGCIFALSHFDLGLFYVR